MWVEGDVSKKAKSSVTITGSQYLLFKIKSGNGKLAVQDITQGLLRMLHGWEGAGDRRRWM